MYTVPDVMDGNLVDRRRSFHDDVFNSGGQSNHDVTERSRSALENESYGLYQPNDGCSGVYSSAAAGSVYGTSANPLLESQQPQDYSIRTFLTDADTLERPGFEAASSTFDMRPSFNPPNPFDGGLPFTQTFWSGTPALSNRSISQLDSSDGFGQYPNALEPHPGSYLTIPSSASSAHTYSYATSSVGSDYVCEQSSPVDISAARIGLHHRNDSNAGSFANSSSPLWGPWRTPTQNMDCLPRMTNAQNVRDINEPNPRSLPSYARSVSSGVIQNTSQNQTDLFAPQNDAAELGIARPSGLYGYAMARRGSTNSSTARQKFDRGWSRRPRSSSASETLQLPGAAQMKRRTSARGSGRNNPGHRTLLSPREAYRGEADHETPSPSTAGGTSQPPPPAPRGRRNGVMTEKGKADATAKRRTGVVCLECKARRVSCKRPTGSNICESCASKGIFCVPHHFNKIRKNMTSMDFLAESYYNCAFSRPRWHPCAPAPTLAELHERLRNARQHTSCIRCWLGTRPLFEIDLSHCLYLLQDVMKESHSTTTFANFIRADMKQRDDGTVPWVQFFDPLTHEADSELRDISRMIYCTEMAAWQNFTAFADWAGSHRTLDPADAVDHSLLETSTILSRLILLRLEHLGYEQLHSRLNSTKPQQTPQLTERLGALLLSIRRRISIWTDYLPALPGRAACVTGARLVCQTLYFHYMRLPADHRPGGKDSLGDSQETVWQALFGSPLEFEDAPTENTEEGFERWLRNGSRYIGPHQGELQLEDFFQQGSSPPDPALGFAFDGSWQ